MVINTFEVFHSFDSELQGGILIADKNGARVLLESRNCPHVVHSLLYGFVQSKGFVCPCDKNHHLSRGKQHYNQSDYLLFIQHTFNSSHLEAKDKDTTILERKYEQSHNPLRANTWQQQGGETPF